MENIENRIILPISVAGMPLNLKIKPKPSFLQDPKGGVFKGKDYMSQKRSWAQSI